MTHKPPLPSVALGNARKLRRESTDAERKVWMALRSMRSQGIRFRRQHSVPPYIVDFCRVAERLIVELDGSQHTKDADAVRTKFLESNGWRILRFWDHDPRLHTEAVADAIRSAIAAPDPHPNPAPEGRGATPPR